MTQVIGVVFYRVLSLSQRMGRRGVGHPAGPASTQGERGILIMLGCLLWVTISFAGMPEEVRRFDHNKDGKSDQWE
jgi:hypothetical protein